MRTWARVSLRGRCGACGTVLEHNTLVQELSFSGMKRKLLRCVSCADGPAPLDLPVLTERHEHGRSTKPMKSLAPLAANATREWMAHKNE